MINLTLFVHILLVLGIDFDPRIHFKSILNEDIFKSNYMTNNKKNYYNLKYPFSFPNNLNIISLTNHRNTKEANECFVRFDPSDKINTLIPYNKTLSHYSFNEDNFKLIKL